MKIARRFNAGKHEATFRPEGAAEARFVSAVPSGLGPELPLNPTINRWAILESPFGTKNRESERTEIQFLRSRCWLLFKSGIQAPRGFASLMREIRAHAPKTNLDYGLPTADYEARS